VQSDKIATVEVRGLNNKHLLDSCSPPPLVPTIGSTRGVVRSTSKTEWSRLDFFRPDRLRPTFLKRQPKTTSDPVTRNTSSSCVASTIILTCPLTPTIRNLTKRS
jgi:hypothetical protein